MSERLQGTQKTVMDFDTSSQRDYISRDGAGRNIRMCEGIVKKFFERFWQKSLLTKGNPKSEPSNAIRS